MIHQTMECGRLGLLDDEVTSRHACIEPVRVNMAARVLESHEEACAHVLATPGPTTAAATNKLPTCAKRRCDGSAKTLEDQHQFMECGRLGLLDEVTFSHACIEPIKVNMAARVRLESNEEASLSLANDAENLSQNQQQGHETASKRPRSGEGASVSPATMGAQSPRWGDGVQLRQHRLE